MQRRTARRLGVVMPRLFFVKILADEGDSDTLGKVYLTIVPVWRGGDVPQQLKDAMMNALHQKQRGADRTKRWQEPERLHAPELTLLFFFPTRSFVGS